MKLVSLVASLLIASFGFAVPAFAETQSPAKSHQVAVKKVKKVVKPVVKTKKVAKPVKNVKKYCKVKKGCFWSKK